MEAALDPEMLRRSLVDQLKQAGHIRSEGVEGALRAVPRHLFLPGVPVSRVYRDEAIPTRHRDRVPISSSSQPAIMAIMLEQLALEPGHRVLEVGAGTGYNAALMAHMVGAAGRVVTIDIDDDIVEEARTHLAAAGYDRVQVVCGDGGLGYADAAPYDRIILTVGAPDILPAWRDQLGPGGRLVLPLSLRGEQSCVAFEHRGHHLASVSIRCCGFMPLRGAFAGRQSLFRLGPEPNLTLFLADGEGVDGDRVYNLLVGAFRDLPTGVAVTLEETAGLLLWLALREPGYCRVWAEGTPAARQTVPFLMGSSGTSFGSSGVLDGEQLCLLMRPGAPSDDSAPIELLVRSYGRDDALARRVIGHIVAWDMSGRPGLDHLRIRVYPRGPAGTDAAAATLLTPWNRLVLEWQN